jgi:hypothetical protein
VRFATVLYNFAVGLRAFDLPRRRSVHTALHFSATGKQTSGPKLRRNGPVAVFDWPSASRCTRFRLSRKLRTRELDMRTNAKFTTCAIVGMCLIFTQLHPGLLAQDTPNGPLSASIDDESQPARVGRFYEWSKRRIPGIPILQPAVDESPKASPGLCSGADGERDVEGRSH